MVGYLSYDVVRRWERLPDANPDEIGVPELAMLLATDLAVLDHHDGSVLLIANAINYDATDERVDDAWADAVRRLDAMQADLARAPAASGHRDLRRAAVGEVASRTDADTYMAGVEACREYIRAGDAFQIVLSQRFSAPSPASSLDVYRVLRVTNPSPYMYLLRVPVVTDDGSLSGRGRVRHRRLLARGPGHGRGRSGAAAPDRRLAAARRDARRTTTRSPTSCSPTRRSEPSTSCWSTSGATTSDAWPPTAVWPPRICSWIERYSHVMHIVSTVVGTLAEGRTAYDVLAATFPAGTLSGAPKPRAMEIIDELEPVRRGVYAGCVGYLDFAGDLDTAIAIRTAVIKDGIAHVQAGAGLVADSVPATEHEECGNKAAAVLRAVAMAARPCAPPARDGDDARPAGPSAVEPDRRGYRRALVLLAVGAALLFLGYAQVWASAVVLQEGLPSLVVELTGPGDPRRRPSALLALAGMAGLVATAPVRPRRHRRPADPRGAPGAGGRALVRHRCGQRADVVRLVSEKAGIDVEVELSVRPWWLVVASGASSWSGAPWRPSWRGGTWPVCGRRYGDGDARRRPRHAPSARPATAWDQLDQGVDPTVDPRATRQGDPAPAPTRGRPDDLVE